MKLQEYKELLSRFLSSKEAEVLDFFRSFRDSQSTDQFVYIPGSRKDRVLLVAHADTAGRTGHPFWYGDAAVTGQWGTGYSYQKGHLVLGADDRAGCALMYNIFTGDHSLLITTGEEKGCVGARAATAHMADELARHQFAVEVDRRGDRQAVFYDVATKSFKDYILRKLDQYDFDREPWTEEVGSFTDIAHICDTVGICGVNLSAGYVSEHTSQETLLLGAWLHTRTVLRRVLQQPVIPRFSLPKRVVRVVKTADPFGPNGGSGKNSGTAATTTETKLKPDPAQDPSRGGLWVKFRNISLNVNMLSKNKKRALVKGIKKDMEAGKISREHAIALVMQILPDKAHTIPISEEEREGFYLGRHWEQHQTKHPSAPIHQEVTPRQPIAGYISPPKRQCYHRVEEGRYCERCLGIVGMSEMNISHGRKCLHGVPFEQECDLCNDTLGDVSLITGKVCDHGILLTMTCQRCSELYAPETEEVERKAPPFEEDGELIEEVVESETTLERRSLSPRPKRSDGELDFGGVQALTPDDGYHLEEGVESPFNIDS